MNCKKALWFVPLVALALPASLFAQVTPDRVEAVRVEHPQRPWVNEERGALYVRAQGGAWQKAPTVAINFKLAITGLIVRTEVSHQLTNPSDSTVEASYVYPLPAGAMVDGLRIEAQRSSCRHRRRRSRRVEVRLLAVRETPLLLARIKSADAR